MGVALRKNITLTDEENQVILDFCKKMGRSFSEVVRTATLNYIAETEKEDLATFLSTQAGSEIQDVQVNITKDNISLTGKMNVGMVFKGAVKLDGNLELKDNTLLFAPKKFTINGATIPGLTSNVLEATEIYNFNNFPIPVKAESLTIDNGEIHIKVKPVLN